MRIFGNATLLLAVAWGGLGLFLLWDAQQSGMTLEYVLGAVACVVAVGNVALWRRKTRS